MQTNTPRPRSRSSLLSPVGPGRRTPVPNSARAAIRVVAQEIDGLAHFRNAVGNRAAALAHAVRDQLGHALFEQIGRALEDLGALARGRRVPLRLRARRGGERGIDRRRVGVRHRADDLVEVRRIAHLDALALDAGLPSTIGAALHLRCVACPTCVMQARRIPPDRRDSRRVN